jgi:hypothetical protein
MRYVFLFLLTFVSCSRTYEETHNTIIPENEQPKIENGYTVIQSPTGLKYHTGLLKSTEDLDIKNTYLVLQDCENLPDQFDLRPLGLVSSVKDQGQCGSCSMFSKTSSFESALLGQGINLDLSEQELVSNDKEQYGCDGGFMGFNYQVKHGQGLETDFPYTSGKTGRNGRSKEIPVAAKGLSWAYVGAKNRALIKAFFRSRLVPLMHGDHLLKMRRLLTATAEDLKQTT